MSILIVNDLLLYNWLREILIKTRSKAWPELVNICDEGYENFLLDKELPIAGHPEVLVRRLIKRQISRFSLYQYYTRRLYDAAVSLNAGLPTSWLQGAKVEFHTSPPVREVNMDLQISSEENTVSDAVRVVFRRRRHSSQCIKLLGERWGTSKLPSRKYD